MSEASVCALGNAIVDILLEVSEEQFADLGLKKGAMDLVDAGTQKQLLQRFSDSHPILVSGGSVANSIIAFSKLGGKCSFTGCVGDDRYGLHYEGEFEQLGIAFEQPVIVGETTGTCVVLITPDAERTMQTNLGVSALLGEGNVKESVVAASDWLVIEGYILSNESGQRAARAAVRLAKANGTKVAVTFAAEFIVQVFGEVLREVVSSSDMVITNIEEAMAFTGGSSVAECMQSLEELVSHVVVTEGENGAHVSVDGKRSFTPAVKTEAKDATGAGDMFAGAYLYGICHGYPAEVSAKGACALASKVIQCIGARLHGDIEEFWKEATRDA